MDLFNVESREREKEMYPVDVPQIKDNAAQVEFDIDARARLSIDAAYLLANKPQSRNGDVVNQNVENLGAVDQIALPAGWQKGKETQGIAGMGSMVQFHPAGKADVELTSFDRGRRYRASAEAFNSVIAKPAHVISPKELESLKPMLGNYADERAFAMTACRTEAISGKTVLVVEGTWKATGQRSYSILVNGDGSGETFQEIFFKAPEADYKAHLAQAQAAIRSIRWK